MKTTVIAITGGIATGKSSGLLLLREKLGEGECVVFDCDAEAHYLLTNPLIVATIHEEFGSGVLNPDGSVNRSALRNLVFENDTRRQELERILHPKILNSAQNALADAISQDNPPSFLLMEIPLLYEVDFPVKRDMDILFAASRETQIQRLTENRKLDQETIAALLASQLPIKSKIDPADKVIWNDGSAEEFELQIELLSRMLSSQRHLTIS